NARYGVHSMRENGCEARVKVLLVGSGGREHALGWKLTQSSRVDELISLPGNPGLALLGPVVEGVNPLDVGAVAALARIHAVDLVVIGPEAPLAAGLADAVSALGIPVFGPRRAAARLEASKAFAKDVMRRAGVPTAEAWTFTDRHAAHEHIGDRVGPHVIKADGLAAGKGVLVSDDDEAAHAWVDRCFDGGFGEAGATVVIEEYLSGPEVSVFAICSGTDAVALAPARDYKRLYDGDLGPNTGGMGSYSPVDDLPPRLVSDTVEDVIRPTLLQLDSDGHPYTGFLYAGLILTDEGPRVLEFNVRLGDPETQVVLPRLESDLVDMIEAALAGSVVEPEWSPRAAVEVVLAAEGYPDSPISGTAIRGLDRVPEDVLVFHAGTAREGEKTVTAGGRVVNVVGLGPTRAEARERAYAGAERIRWPGMQYRADIAAD
ncbi:MAG TPA: phosphoribosylamine--glycine ligase, partial [Acidimicrobiia bacterium]|nr:phosphoribosylamine--glycine ligase [Acidimicrobiia bacterium]